MNNVQIKLDNPNFDRDWYQFEDIGELTIPVGWRPWWTKGDPKMQAQGYLVRPEFKPEKLRVRSEPTGVKWFTTFATHNAGLYQLVQVPAPCTLTLSAWVQYWSEHTDKSGGGYAMQVGIDPTGAQRPCSNTIKWGS